MLGYSNPFAAGQDFWDKFKDWASDSGVTLVENILTAAVIFALGYFAIRFLDKLLRKTLVDRGRKTLLINFIVSVVTKVCWAIVVVTCLSSLGIDVGPLIAGLGVTGFILGFAFQESLGNLASGMMIAINEPFKVGDFVEAAGHAGTVTEVNMMATVLASPDNKRLVLPNKSVWGGPIVNYSALGTRRVDLQVGIAYGEDIAHALEVITEAVKAVPGVLAEPAPTIAVASLDDSQVTVNVRPWTKGDVYWDVYSATLKAVKDELGRAGVEIPFPQVVMHQGAPKK